MNVNVNVEAVLVTVGFGDGWVGEAFGSSVCHVRAGSRSSAGKSCVSLIDHCARLIDWGSSPSARQDSSELVIAIGRVDSAPFHSSIHLHIQSLEAILYDKYIQNICTIEKYEMRYVQNILHRTNWQSPSAKLDTIFFENYIEKINTLSAIILLPHSPVHKCRNSKIALVPVS